MSLDWGNLETSIEALRDPFQLPKTKLKTCWQPRRALINDR